MTQSQFYGLSKTVTNILKKPTRRAFLFSAGAVALTGCTNSTQSGLGDAVTIFRDSLKDQSFTTANVENIPFASIGVRTDGAEALVVLGNVEGEELHWIAADRSLIVTQHGRITHFHGLGTNIDSAPERSQDPVACGRLASAAVHNCVRMIDFPVARLYGVVVKSEIREIGTQTVSLLYGDITTRLFEETGGNDGLGWQFTNEFCLDMSGNRIWRSVQHVSPELPPVQIRVLKPFNGAAA